MKKYFIPRLILNFAFTLLVDVSGQKVGIGVPAPDHQLHIRSATPAVLKLENSTTLNPGVRSDLFFSCGGSYTGAIKTIGASDVEARLAFFTYAAVNPVELKERISILDNGNVGFDNKKRNAVK